VLDDSKETTTKEQEMSEELFPKTAEEELATVRAKLQADYDKADTAVDKAVEKRNDAEDLLTTFDDAIAQQGATMAMIDKRLSDAQERLGGKGGEEA
jgi:hypothetical protein